ncbi:MAG: hypothetical protein KAU50_03375 [Candidatus Marinimicrobia bacterium]|nr:hypothetical protein [Candidatus Neomarinimicrobiota bacterium]
MTYPASLREEAFVLFCEGIGAESIVAELGRRHPDEKPPSPSVIKLWDARFNWRQRRAELQSKIRARADEQQLERGARILEQFSDLRQNIFDELSAVQFRSREGAVRSLAMVQKVIETSAGEGKADLDKLKLKMIEVIFTVLLQNNELAPLMIKHKPQLLEQINKALQRKTITN